MMVVSSHNAHSHQTRNPFFVTPLCVADCRLCFEQHTSTCESSTRRHTHTPTHRRHHSTKVGRTPAPLVPWSHCHSGTWVCALEASTPPTASDTHARKLQSATLFPPINFRIKTSIPTWLEPLIAPYPSSVLPLSQESPSAPQARRQHSPPRGFSNPTAPGLQSLQAHGPAAVRLSEADSVAASSGLLKSKRCLRIWRVRCRVATYVNIALNLFISPYC